MKIAAIPQEFKVFFNRYRDLFSLPQFYLFQSYTYGIIVMPKDKKNVSQIAKSYVEPVCRSSLQKLISELKFDFQKIIKRSQTQLIRALSHRRKHNRKIELVLDDTTLKKFGKSVFGAAWYKKRKDELPYLGIQIVVLGLLIDDWLIPIDFRIYVPQQKAKDIPMKFKTKMEMAASMIRKLWLPTEYRVELLFDSWYLNEKVTKAAEERGWEWYSRCRSNRKVRWEGENKSFKNSLQLKCYAKSVKWKNLDYQSKRKRRAVVGHQRIGELPKIGRLKFVMTSLEGDEGVKWAFFCTNQTRVQLVEVVKKYERRWKIEVFFRESRAHFALEKWYFRRITSVVHHLCLCLVAAVACICVRLEQRKDDEELGSWGKFVENVKKENQRGVMRWIFEQCDFKHDIVKDDNKFGELCNSLGF